jgi:hypothetical protein
MTLDFTPVLGFILLCRPQGRDLRDNPVVTFVVNTACVPAMGAQLRHHCSTDAIKAYEAAYRAFVKPMMRYPLSELRCLDLSGWTGDPNITLKLFLRGMIRRLLGLRRGNQKSKTLDQWHQSRFRTTVNILSAVYEQLE